MLSKTSFMYKTDLGTSQPTKPQCEKWKGASQAPTLSVDLMTIKTCEDH